MNGFALSFGYMLITNIMIRQVMINLVAVFMHNDYHHACIESKKRLDKKMEDLK